MDEFENSKEQYRIRVSENFLKIQREDSICRIFAARELAKIAKKELQNDKGRRILFDLVSLLEFGLETQKCFCEEIIWALGAIGSEEAVDILIKSMDNEIADIRLKAVRALGKIGGGKVKKALGKKLTMDEKKSKETGYGSEDEKITWEIEKILGKRNGQNTGGNGLMNPRGSFTKERVHAYYRRNKPLNILKKIARAIIPFVQ